jgi:hypothetical protein
MTYRELALQHALKEVGVREHGANNHGQRVEWYQKWDSLPGEGYAWCNSFVDAMFAAAGRPLVELARSAGVSLTLDLARKHHWEVLRPQRADLVVFRFSHIGFVYAAKGDYLITVEGNTGPTGAVSDSKGGGDGVYVKRRHRTLALAYIRVPGEVHAKRPHLPAPPRGGGGGTRRST